MIPRATVAAVLARAGWSEEPPRNRADAAFVKLGGAARELVLEVHGPRLWLWIEGYGDRRVLQMEPGAGLSAVLDAVVARQATLSVATYLTDYMDLAGLCPTSIVAWEQFEPNR